MQRKVVVFLLLALLCFGCGESKQAIRDYAGDGQPRYLKAPGFLGIDGIAIEMPHFDLQNGIDIEYDLAGIPPGNPYVIYLVVPLTQQQQKKHLESILAVEWTFTLKKNGAEVASVSDTLAAMTNNQFTRFMPSGGKNKIIVTINRFSRHSSDYSSYLHSMDPKDHWTLAVHVINQTVPAPVEAYIVLERGGFK
jgi:hypothetical protein